MRLLTRMKVGSQSKLSRVTRWQGSGDSNDRGFPRGVRGVEVDLTPISMMLVIVHIESTRTDNRPVEPLLDIWAQNHLLMLLHLRMIFPKSSETPIESVSSPTSTSLYARTCCAPSLRSHTINSPRNDSLQGRG
jgi:hypothetical protein